MGDGGNDTEHKSLRCHSLLRPAQGTDPPEIPGEVLTRMEPQARG